MIELLEVIALSTSRRGRAANLEDIVDAQRTLRENKNAPIPNEFIDFLETVNGIEYNGGEIFCVNPPYDFSADIVDINLGQLQFDKKKYTVLGANEFDYMVYNLEKDNYQIIDKSDLKVLEEYESLKNTIAYILKV